MPYSPLMKPRSYWQESLLLSELSTSGGVGPEPEATREDGCLVVARGDLTLSVHKIAESGARLFERSGPLLILDAPVRLRHEIEGEGELACLTLMPGWFAVTFFERRWNWSTDGRAFIERPGVVRLIELTAPELARATTIDFPTHHVEILQLSLGECAWLTGSGIRIQEDCQGNRFYFAEAGGTFHHERNGKSTRIRLPRRPFRIVWL